LADKGEHFPSIPKWNYDAEIITACNCDWGCPCNFNAPPTYGGCDGGWALKIRKGVCGEEILDDLAFGLMASWPGAIHEGKGTAKLFIDSAGSKKQRHLLEQIVKGKFKGEPWPIFAPTFDTWLDTVFLPFEWKFDGAKSSYRAGDQVIAVLEKMRNPVTGAEVTSKIVLPDGITAKELNMTSTRAFSVFSEGLKYAHPGKNAWYSVVSHGS
jgi:hypothetical protein